VGAVAILVDIGAMGEPVGAAAALPVRAGLVAVEVLLVGHMVVMAMAEGTAGMVAVDMGMVAAEGAAVVAGEDLVLMARVVAGVGA